VPEYRRIAPMASERARTLRKNLTDAEAILWRRLRRKELDHYRFRRQQPIGPYVVDFFCAEAKLIVELDGGQHNEAASLVRDARRTEWLEARGYRVLRFWNNQVREQLDGVLETILDNLHGAG
jgi:very-short-patch-repair endonuclease